MEGGEINGVLLGAYGRQVSLGMDRKVGVVSLVGEEWRDPCGSIWSVSGRVQDWERTRRPGTCGAPTYLQGVTQGERIPAECLSRNEKKAGVSFYSSPAIYNGWVTRRKELKKKAVTRYW